MSTPPNPRPASATDTVAIKPFYALEAATPPSEMAYRVVQLSDTGPVAQPPAHRMAEETATPEPREPRGELEDREVRRLLAKIRREVHGQFWLPPPPRPLERNGWECIGYSLRMWGTVLRLAALWTIFSPLFILALPNPEDLGVDTLIPRISVIAATFALLGMSWSFMRQVIARAVVGDCENYAKLFPGVRALLFSSLAVVATFFAGPAVLLAVAVWFWIDAGVLEWGDHAILWELWLAAGVCWAYLLLAVDERFFPRADQDSAVVPSSRRGGWPDVVFSLAGGASLTVFGYLSVSVWVANFDNGIRAFVVQNLLWCAALFVWAFLARWYGVTCFWRAQAGAVR